MALTRKFLAEMCIKDDKIDQIIEAHTDTVNGLKDEIKKYKADAEKLPGVQKELKKLQDDAEANGRDPYKVKYEAMKEEFESYKKDVETKETKAKKDAAYKALLKEAGVSDKRIDAVLKVSDVDGLDFDEVCKSFEAVGCKAEVSDHINFTKSAVIRIEIDTKSGIPWIIQDFMWAWTVRERMLNDLENKYLAEFRDALLPDLMRMNGI